MIGSDSDSVPGAAGETTKNYLEGWGIPNIVVADGPAGVRISQSFEGTDATTGETQTYYQSAPHGRSAPCLPRRGMWT